MKTTVLTLLLLVAVGLAGTPTPKYDRSVKSADLQYKAAVEKAAKARDSRIVAARKLAVRDLLLRFRQAQRMGMVAATLDLAKAIYRFDQGHKDALTLLSVANIDLKSLPVEPEIGKPKAKAKPKAKPTTRPAKNSVVWKGHHYLVVTTKLSWLEAKKKCEEAGGHLARIESKEENAFLSRLASQFNKVACFVDGSLEEGKWVFSDGKPVTFFNWKESQPFTEGGRKRLALYLRDEDRGKFVASQGKGGYTFICEWDN